LRACLEQSRTFFLCLRLKPGSLHSPQRRHSVVPCAFSLRFPILQIALQPLKIRTDTRFWKCAKTVQ
jgi:hypothetical protein